MKKVRTQEAVGSVLCHDLTKIVPGEFKGRAFKKGHVITEADVQELLDIGKYHLYVWEKQEGMLHEDEAAIRVAKAAAGPHILTSEPKEGKVNLVAATNGLLKVDRKLLAEVNRQEQVVLASRHDNILVKEGEVLAGSRVVPLVIGEDQIIRVENLCQGSKLLEVKPLRLFRVGLIITGSEVFHGRIKDAFGPVLEQKFTALGSLVTEKIFVPDNTDEITGAIRNLVAKPVDLIAVSGGMSVDPDDLTPGAIRASGAEVVGYGAPVLPGSMFMLGYLGAIPVVGLPGCVMYSAASIFDLVIPRVLAGERIVKEDLQALAYGGLCLQCPECRYPVCPFGKG